MVRVMCEENEELELNEEDTIESLSKEQLIELVYSLLNQKDKEIQIGTDELETISIDKNEFKKGVKSVSSICGSLSALMSIGVDLQSAIELVLNERNISYNLESLEISNKSNERVANIQNIKVEQNQI